MDKKLCNPKALILSLILAFWASGAMAAGIKIVPSATRVSPGEAFSVDVVAEGIPSEGLGTVQFRLNVNATGGSIAGVTDLIQAKAGDISVSTPLQISSPSSNRSGLGDFFWNGKGANGILVMDNEPLNNGSALYTYAHTNGSTLPVGSGTVARFQVAVGSAVEAENINISLSDVMLLDGGTEYPLEYNNGATVQLRCMTTTPSLLGMTFSEAKTALEGANLALGNVYEISNNGSRSLNVVLEQSSQSGASLLCQTPVDLAINTAPTDVAQATAADKVGDDTGGVILSWVPSSSTDVAGYKVYSSSTLLKTINAPSATGTEIGGFANGTAYQLKVATYDTYGNESQGVAIQATALDDVPPVITVEGVQEGSYYSTDVTPLVNVSDNHLSTKTITLNNSAYNGTAITSDGSYSLSISADDLSGNHSSKTISFAVDKTPPTIAITGIEEGRYYNIDLSPVVIVSDTNLKEKTVTLNSQPYNGYLITAEGSYVMTVNAVDVVGHSSSETRHFYIDKTAPVSATSISTPKVEEGGNIFVTGSTPLTLSALDSGSVSSGVNKSEYTIDGAAWNTYGNGITISSTADGLHAISYKSTDNAGNAETSRQISLTIDNSAPVTTLTVGEPKSQAQDGSLFINHGTVFTLSASDAYSGVSKSEYRVNNGQWTAYAPFNMANEGAYHIEYRSVDRLGNAETAKSLNAIVDNTPPVTAHSIGAPKHTTSGNTNYVTGNTVITLAAEDSSSGVAVTEYRIDGGAWTTYALITIQAEGNHQIEYRSKDRTGNVEETKSVSVTVDNMPPVTNITTGTPNYTAQDGRILVTSSTQFTLSSTDSGSGVKGTEYRIDGGNWTYYASFALQGSGNHLIEYRAIDNVDNTEASMSLAVTVDDTPPVTKITATGAKYPSTAGIIYVTKDTAFTLAASDDLSGVAKTEYRIDNGAWTAYAPFAVTVEGEHTISYRSSDNLGNLEGTKVYTLIVDNTPPMSEITVGSPKHTDSSGTLFITGETTMTITASDSSSGVAHTDYRVDGGQWQAYEPFRISTEGHHVIEYRSADNVANTEEPKNLSVTIDNTPPITEISVGTPKFTSTGGVLYVTGVTAFTLTASDNLSGVEKTDYRIDGGEWYASAPFTIAAEGSHLIEYRSADNVGNLENIRSLSVVVDNTPPVSNLTLGTPKHEANGSIYISGSTSFTMSASDTLSRVKGMEYRIDGGQWTEYTAYFSLSTLSDGQHTIYYRASDNVGNVEPEKTLTFIIDNTPPETAISVSMPKFTGTNGSLYITKDTGITLASTDNLSGISKVEYRIDNGAWTEYAAFKISAEGNHVIGFKSTDNLGNTETEKTLSVTVDNTPPVSSIATGEPKHTASDGTLFVTGSTAFTLIASDSLSGVAKTEYRVDSGTWTAYASPFNISSEGSHLIEYRSTDNVGNAEQIHTLAVIVDNTPPVSSITVGTPKYDVNGNVYVTAATQFNLGAVDNLSGVNGTEYRIDGGEWTGYAAAFNLVSLSDGSHSISYRSVDNLGNIETEKTLSVFVDNTPPVTNVTAGLPKYETGNTIYVAGKTVFTLSATDNLSGVKDTEYRIDNSSWVTGTSLSVPGEGNRTIAYRSRDNVDNVETEKSINIIVDNTPPVSTVDFNQQKYTDGQNTLVSRNTQVILASTDNLSGVKATYYRLDDEDGWRTYTGAFRLTDLTFGVHTIHYRSSDNVENSETEKSVTVVLVGIEVETNVINLPRVLVWTRDPSKVTGNNKPTYMLDDIKGFVSSAMNDKDIYFKMTTDKDVFQQEFRSGIYNMAAVIDQDTPFDAVFMREMREAVNSGMGLLISGWGNTTPPILEEALGVQVSGSLSATDSDRAIYLYQSLMSPEESLTAKGKILKTSLTTGTLAGIVKGEEACDGVKGVSFRYQTKLISGDTIKAYLYTSSGKKLSLVDEETLSVDNLPSDGINSYGGNVSGDIGIDSATSDSVTFSVKAPSGYLESSYYVSLTVQHQDGNKTSTDNVAVSPTCSANLQAGVAIGPFNVIAVQADSHKITDNLPAVVLNSYGKGRAVFLSYDIVESAMNRNMAEYAGLLKNAMNYILPQDVKPEAAGISLLETKVKLHGTPMDLKAVDTLVEGLTLLPLFSLTKTPLEYTFHLSDGEETAYRYFVRVKDKIGSYGKDTDIYLGIGSGYTLFDKYQYNFAIDTDSDLLMQQAVAWVNEQLAAYPEATDSLNTIYNELVTIAFMPKLTEADMDKVIHQVVQTIHQINQLPFDTARGREIVDGYLRVMEGYFK